MFFSFVFFFFFNDTAPTDIYTLSLHDALPISPAHARTQGVWRGGRARGHSGTAGSYARAFRLDRKSTRLNSSHLGISYAVFCLKKKKKTQKAKQCSKPANIRLVILSGTSQTPE